MNLKDFDKSFDDASASSSGTTEIPDGKYVMKVSDTDVFDSQDGRPYLKITLQVESGDYKGACVTKIHSLDNPERFKFLKGDLITCGLFLKKLSDIETDHPKIRGVVLNVQAKKKGEFANFFLNSRVAAPSSGSSNSIPF